MGVVGSNPIISTTQTEQVGKTPDLFCISVQTGEKTRAIGGDDAAVGDFRDGPYDEEVGDNRDGGNVRIYSYSNI